jgi:hypothetical protein
MKKKVFAALVVTGGVYFLYVPYALPVLDDWMFLQLFHQARAGGITGDLAFLRHLVDNTWIVQFRIFWASLLPVFALSFAADFAGKAYFLLAWTAHLLTAYLLWRIAAAISGDSETAFAAGAIYMVFPAATNPLFWPVSNAVYYIQSLALLAWFWLTWKKLVLQGDCRYSWKDFALLAGAIFTGEQILPALAILLPVALLLLGKRERRREYVRFCILHLALMAVLLGVYTFAVNAAPVWKGFQNRYASVHRWSLRPVAYLLFGALGLNRDFVPWPGHWWADRALIGLFAAAALSFLGVVGPRQKPSNAGRFGEMLLWSVAGAILTYLPLARLSTFEWRYLYVPSMFLVSGGAALLGVLRRPLRLALSFTALAYCITQTYLSMRHCWIPQSREARAALDAVAASRFAPYDIVILSGDHLANGLAPSFITGASWAQQSMLEHCTGAGHIQGARDLVVNEKGEMALYRRDSFRYFHRQEISRLRIFVRDPSTNRFLPKFVLALPVQDGRYQIVRLGSSQQEPPAPLSLEELKRLPQFGEIYFARRIHSHMKPTDL